MSQESNLEAGEELYNRHCATCHGESGGGQGMAGQMQTLKPADLTDSTGVASKPLDYWFWRVSEGGSAEPFHLKGSVMPAWKPHLSQEEIWQVIAYSRSLGD